MFLYPFTNFFYTPAGSQTPMDYENSAVRLSEIQYFSAGMVPVNPKMHADYDSIPCIDLYLKGRTEPVRWIFSDLDEYYHRVWSALREALEVKFIDE